VEIMERINYEELWPHINCFVPIYDENGGNITKVYLDDGTFIIDNRRLTLVIEKIAGVFAVDLKNVRKKYSKLIDRKNTIPIPLHQDLILVPVKMRKPVAREDGAWGYIVLSKVQAYSNHPTKPNSIEITFGDGTTIEGLLLKRNFEIILQNARKVYKAYTQLFLISRNSKASSDLNSNEIDKIKEEVYEYYINEFIRKRVLNHYLQDICKISVKPG
jgi:hypothetical protein